MEVAIVAMLSVSAVGARAQATDADQWGSLVAANDLDLKGNTPFHLAMTVQLYDMNGKPAETGSVEERWDEVWAGCRGGCVP